MLIGCFAVTDNASFFPVFLFSNNHNQCFSTNSCSFAFIYGHLDRYYVNFCPLFVESLHKKCLVFVISENTVRYGA